MITQKYRTCVKCGCIGGKFITRKDKLKSGKIVIYIGKICAPCAREESQKRYKKLWKNTAWRNKKIYKIKSYKKNNPKEVSDANHKYYIKNRVKILSHSKQEYVPIKKNPLKKRSHRRVPSKNHILRKFNFKNDTKPSY